MGVEPKIGGFDLQNGWWKFHGKPYEQMDDLGGKTHLFLVQHHETPISGIPMQYYLPPFTACHDCILGWSKLHIQWSPQHISWESKCSCHSYPFKKIQALFQSYTTLPETNIFAPENWCFKRWSFPFGMAQPGRCKMLVSGRVPFSPNFHSNGLDICLRLGSSSKAALKNSSTWSCPQKVHQGSWRPGMSFFGG